MKYSLILPALLIFLASCGDSKTKTKEVNTASADSNKVEAFAVHESNPAWTSAPELKKRLSPPKSEVFQKNDFSMAVHYSAPKVKNRNIWDSLVPYDQVWRTGANEATLLEFSHDVHIDNKHIKAGSYALFTIPSENEWTVILNEDSDQWGAYDYDESADVIRFSVPVDSAGFEEDLSFKIEDKGADSAVLNFHWENKSFKFPVSYAKHEHN